MLGVARKRFIRHTGFGQVACDDRVTTDGSRQLAAETERIARLARVIESDDDLVRHWRSAARYRTTVPSILSHPPGCRVHHAPTTPRTIRMTPSAKAPITAARRPRRASQARNDVTARCVLSGASA
jgi:hypothetical protein